MPQVTSSLLTPKSNPFSNLLNGPTSNSTASAALNNKIQGTSSTPSFNPTPTQAPITHVTPTLHPSTVSTTDTLGNTTKSTYDTAQGVLDAFNNKTTPPPTAPNTPTQNSSTLTPQQVNAQSGGTGILPAANTPQINQSSQTASNTNSNPTNFGGIIGNLVNSSNQGNSVAGSAASSLGGVDYAGLIKSAQDANARAVGINKDLNQAEADVTRKHIPISFQQGEQAALQRDYGVQAAAATQEAQQANALAGLGESSLSSAGGLGNQSQGLLQGGLTSAGGLRKPTGNIINVDPVTGLPVAGGSLGNLAQVAGEVQGLQSGAAANAAAGGNIEAQNKTALGTAPTAANAKSISDYTTQVNTTQKSVESLNNLANQLVPNMGTVNFNPNDTPVGNQTYQQYFANKNPAAYAGITAGLSEIKNQVSNVVAAATGLTPTGVTALADKVDLTAMSPQQLSDFLEYINQFAQSNMAAANKSIKDIQNGTQPTPNPIILPNPATTATGEAGVATGIVAAQGFLNAVKSNLGSVIGGAVGGYAESKLK